MGHTNTHTKFEILQLFLVRVFTPRITHFASINQLPAELLVMK